MQDYNGADYYEILREEDAGTCPDTGYSLTTYWLMDKQTGETRVLRECALLDLEVFGEEDFEECDAQ